MAYTLELSRQAEKFLESASPLLYARLRKSVDALTENPRPVGCKKMKNGEGYRIRVGDYRIIYDIEDKMIVVYIARIDRRDKVYS